MQEALRSWRYGQVSHKRNKTFFSAYSQFEIISSLVLDENEDNMFLVRSLQIQNHRRATLVAV